MPYASLQACLADLERTGQLRRVDVPINPNLEAAEIQRRVFRAGGPALLFTNVVGCQFPMACNLFGTRERMRFLFRDTLQAVRHLVELKIEPGAFWKQPWRFRDVPRALWHLRPKFVSRGPVLARQTTVSHLPQLKCWPNDGGAFITLPQVYTEDASQPGWRHSNLGMYRVQISGGQYEPGKQVGIHYQLHRGIGMHHAAAIHRKEGLRVNVFVDGPPAMTIAAVMPMPEGLSELAFAGILGRRRVPMISRPDELPIHAEADFALTGYIEPKWELPEGPFGAHDGQRRFHRPCGVRHCLQRYGASWRSVSSAFLK